MRTRCSCQPVDLTLPFTCLKSIRTPYSSNIYLEDFNLCLTYNWSLSIVSLTIIYRLGPKFVYSPIQVRSVWHRKGTAETFLERIPFRSCLIVFSFFCTGSFTVHITWIYGNSIILKEHFSLRVLHRKVRIKLVIFDSEDLDKKIYNIEIGISKSCISVENTPDGVIRTEIPDSSQSREKRK